MERFYYKKSRLNQLRGFVTTVQSSCSARQAAEKLGVEPATIGKQIASLEDSLNVKLFDRTANHRLKITQYGEEFYKMAVERLQAMDGLFKEFIDKISQNEANKIVIAGHHIVLSHILPPYLHKIRENYKEEDLQIKLCNISKTEAIKRVIAEKVDFAIFPVQEDEEVPPEVEYNNFLDYEPVVIMNKNHPLAKKDTIDIEDIKNNEFLIVDKFSVKATMNSWLNNYKIGSNFEFENASWEILKNIVYSNNVITGFSKIYMNDTEKDFIVKDISHIFSNKMFFSIVTKKNGYIKDKVLNLLNCLKAK